MSSVDDIVADEQWRT